jgi:hypothetical protein
MRRLIVAFAVFSSVICLSSQPSGQQSSGQQSGGDIQIRGEPEGPAHCADGFAYGFPSGSCGPSVSDSGYRRLISNNELKGPTGIAGDYYIQWTEDHYAGPNGPS